MHGGERAAPERERLLWVLSAATFIIFFQAFMVAPILPRLASAFGTSVHTASLLVPAYLIPYGLATVVHGLVADRAGIRPVILASLAAFVVLTALAATAQSVSQLIFWRLATGLGASGVVPLGLVLVGRLFPYEQRGRPLGWIFGAMAGGMAFGSTFGALLDPFIGWRGIFVGVGAVGLIALVWLLRFQDVIAAVYAPVTGGVRALLTTYRRLLASRRGQRTYVNVLVNAVFHSGVFSWLGTLQHGVE